MTPPPQQPQVKQQDQSEVKEQLLRRDTGISTKASVRFRMLWRYLAGLDLRILVRRNEWGIIVIAAVIGVISGLVVTAMNLAAAAMHQSIFGIGSDERLSSSEISNTILLFLAPIVGGIILGITILVLARFRKRPMVDPIEANALHGGKLSLTDSFIIVYQNLVSNGFGASVGLEAGYTQLAAGFASKIGNKLSLRRADMRILVGCGAAGAISAAFNAPLTGAFYAFELVIGSYTTASLAPVVVSALVATLVARQFIDISFIVEMGMLQSVSPGDFVPAIILGACCAGVGIVLMKGVATIEELSRKSSIPAWIRPTLGGIVVGLFAMISPQVMSGGHGALHLNLAHDVALPVLISIFLMKAATSAVSIGAGFRGGLFFASLFLGALLGKIFAFSTAALGLVLLAPVVLAIVGMSALAVAIIGGPLTMTFLALELTGDFPITALVLAAVITSSLIVRTTFGYSFATWRFHLRGESIRSAHDVGWIRNLTVGRMMRSDVKTAPADMSLGDFRRDFPLGATQRVILTDDTGKYAGMILVPEVHGALTDAGDQDENLEKYVRFKNDVLQTQMNAKQAAAIFEKTQSEALAVIDNMIERKVVGQLSESHTLRRYSEELELRRREMVGDSI